MPMFTASASLAAGASVNPLANWQFRIPKRAALLEILVGCAATGIVMNLTTGAESIVQADSVVGAGLTAAVLPSRLNFEPIVDGVDANDEIVLTLRNTSGGAIVWGLVCVMTYR